MAPITTKFFKQAKAVMTDSNTGRLCGQPS